MDILFNADDLADVLAQFNASNEEQNGIFLNSTMSDEMLASQKRYENYIKKHENDN